MVLQVYSHPTTVKTLRSLTAAADPVCESHPSSGSDKLLQPVDLSASHSTAMSKIFLTADEPKPQPMTIEEFLVDLRKRLGRIEKHLIDLKGNPPKKPAKA